MSKSDLKNKFGDNGSMLARLRDEIRLQIHLASMDLQEKWRELESHLPEAERRASDAGVEAKAFVSDIIRQLTELKNKVAHVRGAKAEDDNERPGMTH